MTEKFSFTNESTTTISPDTQIDTREEGLSVEEKQAFDKMKQIATEIGQEVNPEQASEMLKNDPEKVKRLMPKLKKFWAIVNIIGDVVVGGVAMGIMIKNSNPDERMEFTPTNIVALVATVVSIGKLTWDLVGINEKEKKVLKK